MEQGHATIALLLESALDLRERDVLFVRLEAVQKTGEELAIEGPFADAESWVGKLALTYVRQFPTALGQARLLLGIGAGASVGLVPAPFDASYGVHWPYGFVVFVSARPAAMEMRGAMGAGG